MGKIFINYRRSDTSGYAGRLYDNLENHYGHDRLFMDVDTIKGGHNFRKEIENTIAESDLMLVLIGKDWFCSNDVDNNPRINDPDDYVHIEIKAALNAKIPLIPILIKDAEMPKKDKLPKPLESLTSLNAINLTDTKWKSDFLFLIKNVEETYNISGSKIQAEIKKLRSMAYVLAVFSLLSILFFRIGSDFDIPMIGILNYLTLGLVISYSILLGSFARYSRGSKFTQFCVLGGLTVLLIALGATLIALIPLIISVIMIKDVSVNKRLTKTINMDYIIEKMIWGSAFGVIISMIIFNLTVFFLRQEGFKLYVAIGIGLLGGLLSGLLYGLKTKKSRAVDKSNN